MTVASDLQTIRTKVRQVVGSLSAYDLTDDEIDFNINTYYVYDFPEQLRLQTLHTNYRFFTTPNVDTYRFPVEQYISVQKPVFVAGYGVQYYQDQSYFYSLWPKLQFFQQVGTGDGADVAPTLQNLTNLPANRGSVSLSTLAGGETVSYLDDTLGSFLSNAFSIIGITQAAQAIVTLSDLPTYVVGDNIIIQNVQGMTQINGGPYEVVAVAGNNVTIDVDTTAYSAYEALGDAYRQAGTVNYITGVITMNWGVAPDDGAVIQAAYYPYVASRPRSVLFFNNYFTFRPIPDRAYLVETEVFKVPTALLASSQAPELRQWWQLLAYGAALKIFANRQNMEDYAKVMPLYLEQEILANRRTVKQITSQRVGTPYQENTGNNQPYGWDLYGSF